MAGLTRKTILQFGSSGPSTSFGQFGSKAAAAPQTSQDPDVIQQLSAYVEGWQDAVVGGDKTAFLEDMNGWCFVQSYGLVYLYQMGIPEWNTDTLYFVGSIVQRASDGQQFRSLQGGVPGAGAGQSGNALPTSASNAYWEWINATAVLDGGVTVGKIPKASETAPGKLVDSLLSETGGNIVLASGGIKFPDDSVQITAATNPTVVTVQSPPAAYAVTPSRVFSSVYQNTGSKPRFVLVTTNNPNAGGTTFYCDSSATPTTVIASTFFSQDSGAIQTNVMFIVLPGYYYKVVGGTKVHWTEWT